MCDKLCIFGSYTEGKEHVINLQS